MPLTTPHPTPPTSPVAERVRTLPFSGIRRFFDIVASQKNVISLGVGEPDFDTPWNIREAALFSIERGATHYTSNRGELRLRQAIAAYVAQHFGGHYDPLHEILVTVGVSEAIDIALRTILNPGDEVIYHEPCFVSYRPAIILAGGVPVCVETRPNNNFRLTIPMLQAALTPKTRALLLNFPCNPTGAVLSHDDVNKIAQFCIQHNLLLLTDEIYAELTYDSPHHSFIAIPQMKPRTIFLHGMSKAWAMTGFRIGYACAPAEISENMTKLHQYTIMSAPTTGQRAAAEALENDDGAVAAMKAEYRRRRNFVAAAFAQMNLPCHTPAGAFYAFPEIARFGLSSEDFALRLLQEENVAAIPGSAFGPSGEGFLRCAYATAIEPLQEALRRIARFTARLHPPHPPHA